MAWRLFPVTWLVLFFVLPGVLLKGACLVMHSVFAPWLSAWVSVDVLCCTHALPAVLAQRQQELRDKLNGLREGLPGAGTDPGESGRQALDDAGRAMEGAEQALRDGDMSGALDQQAQALESLRDGIGDLNDAQAAQQQAQNGEGQPSTTDPEGRDPLGRRTDKALRNGSDDNLLQGQDVYRRADELLGEIRRRAGDISRPDTERSYLKRLLDLF